MTDTDKAPDKAPDPKPRTPGPDDPWGSGGPLS